MEEFRHDEHPAPIIQTVVGGPLDVNTYIVGLEGAAHCVLIDPGAEPSEVEAALMGRQVDAILLTHAHFDHMLFAQHWLDQGAKLYVHELDAPALHDMRLNMSGMIGIALALPQADVCLTEGDIVREAGLELTVMHTPGHTQGCVCYRCANAILSGDTMFYHSYGRVDLPGGDMEQMVQSLARLKALDEQFIVYPGHGMKTKIAWERGTGL